MAHGQVTPSPNGLTTIANRNGTLVAETAGTTKTLRWYNNSGNTVTLSAVYASVDTAPVGSAVTVTVRKNGSATGAQSLNIAAGANTASLTGIAMTLSPGDYVQAWVTAVGSTTAGTDLSVMAVIQ